MSMDCADRAIAPLPECLYLEVTNRCNLRCRACVQYRGMPEPPRDLTLAETRRIADQLTTLKRAVLHGIGEPFLNEALPDIIRYFKDRAVHVLFNSNGLLLSSEKAARMIDSGLDELRISMDAASEDTYASVRGSHRFTQLVTNIETLLRLKTEKRRSQPRVSAWLLGTQESIRDLPAMILLASRLGIDEVYLQRLVFPLDGAGSGLAERRQAVTDPAPDIREVLAESMKLGRQLGVALNASGLASPEESLQSMSPEQAPWRRCRRPWQVTYVTAWGNVLPCCIAPFATRAYETLILGNAFTENLVDIWNGALYREFRRKHQSDEPPRNCRGCGVEWSL
jgi:MoaA/NifB/PqqE/SkfB family radical SAM enzyme